MDATTTHTRRNKQKPTRLKALQTTMTGITFMLYLLLTGIGTAHAKSPNILWIVTDDQRPDSLTCYNRAVFGQDQSPLGHVESPNIDALAARGTLFTQAYCNSPGCAPSRASMITGLYPSHNGIYGFEQAHAMPGFSQPIFPQRMAERGYFTAYFGKLGFRIYEWGPGLTWNMPPYFDVCVDFNKDLKYKGLTDYYSKEVWGRIDGKPAPLGREEVFFFPDGTRERLFTPAGEVDPEELSALEQQRAALDKRLDILRAYTRLNSKLIIGGRSPMPEDRTLDAYIVRSMESFLNGDGEIVSTGPDPDKPVSIQIGFHFPHTPVLPPQSFRDRFKDKVYHVPEFTKEQLKRLPPQLVKHYQHYKVDDLTDAEKQQMIRDYYAFCAYGDSLVGRAVRAFEDFCKKRNDPYLIIYVCGDHGWHLGEQGISSKFGPYEKSNQGAVIVVSSDDQTFPAGHVVDEYVEYVDFVPTILAHAGADLDNPDLEHLDGFNLADIVTGKIKRDYVIGEMNHVYGPRAYLRTKQFAFSMRVRPWNGKPGQGYEPGQDIRWALEAPRNDVEMALYDLRVDPAERFNVADHPNYVALADYLRDKLGRIVLGDGRVECDWRKENHYTISDFALGADDKQLKLPAEIVPEPIALDESWLTAKAP